MVRSGRTKKRLKSKLRLVIFLVVLAGIFTGGFVLANNLLWPLFIGDNSVAEKERGAQDEEEITELPGISVLMMGVDEREGDRSQRTDTMILANINNKDNRVSLLSIPRDTKVYLPGYGVNKINAANYYGGPEMAMQVVSDLTGVTVDYYMITNFNGFKDIVDALGGVTVDVEKNMYHHEKAYGGQYDINLKKGVQKLDGNQALMYARYRNDELGDITRTQRQLKLLTAIGDEVMKPSVVTKLPKLIPGIYKNVDTNMGVKQLTAMAIAAKNIENVQMATQTLPGWFLDEDGASYWYVDPQKAREVTMALFEEGKVVEVVNGAIDNTSKGNKQVAMEENKTSNNIAEAAAPGPGTGHSHENSEDALDTSGAPGQGATPGEQDNSQGEQSSANLAPAAPPVETNEVDDNSTPSTGDNRQLPENNQHKVRIIIH